MRYSSPRRHRSENLTQELNCLECQSSQRTRGEKVLETAGRSERRGEVGFSIRTYTRDLTLHPNLDVVYKFKAWVPLENFERNEGDEPQRKIDRRTVHEEKT